MKFEIKIGGKKRPVSFGVNQTAVFCEKHDVTIEEIGQRFSGKMTLMDFRDLLWSGLYAGAKEKNIEVDFTEWNVGTWVEEMSGKEVTAVVNNFSSSMPQVKKKIKKARGNPNR